MEARLFFVSCLGTKKDGRALYDGAPVKYVQRVAHGGTGLFLVTAEDGTSFGAYGDELRLEVENA